MAEGSESGRQSVFLVCHGSFNPVQRNHIALMVRARHVLEAAGYHVIRGFLAPACRSMVVQWKGIATLSDEIRFTLLDLACEQFADPPGWLCVDTRGVDYPSAKKLIRRVLEPEMQDQFPGSKGFEVKGSDVAMNDAYYRLELRNPVVIIGREGSIDQVRAGLDLAKKQLLSTAETAEDGQKIGEDLIYAEETLPGDPSLTTKKLRIALCQGDSAAASDILTCDAAVKYLFSIKQQILFSSFDTAMPFEKIHSEDASQAAVKRRRLLPKRRFDGIPWLFDAPEPPARSAAIQVVFVRHGEASNNVNEEGWQERDPPLTAKGEVQASNLRDHALLASMPRPLLVAVSPLRRALQTALLSCVGNCRFIANSDLQEAGHDPCNMGTHQRRLAEDFPNIDFSELGDAWVEQEFPDHHDAAVRVDRFMKWCAALPEHRLVVVTHHNICRKILGVLPENCDVIAVSLDRDSLRWSPLAYVGPKHQTLEWTATRGTGDGVKRLLVAPQHPSMSRMPLGNGWPMLHYAAGGGNIDAVRSILACKGCPSDTGNCGKTAIEWAQRGGWSDVVKTLQGEDIMPSSCLRKGPEDDAEEARPPLHAYFVRHGQALHNSQRSAWAVRDTPLTSVGEDQARALREAGPLARLSRPLLVVTSPLRRAIQTALLACGGECRFVANSDIQETTENPCDTGHPQYFLASEFPRVDFSCLSGESWIEKEMPDHHSTRQRLDRFTQWCAARPEKEIVVVAHQNVCADLLGGVTLENCDVIGVTLNRSSLRWGPLSYENARSMTLKWTSTMGSYDAVSMLLAGGDVVEKMSRDVGEGWPMLHFAAAGGNDSATRALLEARANIEQVDFDGRTALNWAKAEGREEVLKLPQWSAISQEAKV